MIANHDAGGGYRFKSCASLRVLNKFKEMEMKNRIDVTVAFDSAEEVKRFLWDQDAPIQEEATVVFHKCLFHMIGMLKFVGK